MAKDPGLEALRATVDEVAAGLPRARPGVAGLERAGTLRDPRGAPALLRVAALAALALAGAYGAFLGLVRVPQLEEEIDRLSGSSPSSGSVDLLVVTFPRLTRAGSGAETAVPVVVDPDSPLILLAELDPDRLELAPSATYTFEIRDPRDRRVWSTALTGARLKRHLVQSQGVPLLLPAGTLAGGRTLRLVDRSGAELARLALRAARP